MLEIKNKTLGLWFQKYYGRMELRSGISVSFALSFMLSFFAPLELYFINKSEYWFDFYTIIFPIIVQTVLFSICLCLFLLTILAFNKILYRIVVLLETMTLLILYIHGTFIKGGITAINGSDQIIDDKYYTASYVITLCIIVFVFLFLIFEKIQKTLKWINVISLLLIGIMSLALCSEFFIYKGYEQKVNYEYATTRNIMSFSQKENMIVILLDHVDCTNFDVAINEYMLWKGKEVFNDFTYYKNMLAMYPYTYFSIPLLLTGKVYNYQEYFPDYVNQGIKNNVFFNTLKKDNYCIELYEEGIGREYLIDRSITKEFDNMDSNKRVIKKYSDFCRLMDTIVLYEYLPYYFKEVMDINNVDFNEVSKNTTGKEFYEWENISFYKLMDQMKVNQPRKCFKFIHLRGGHPNFKTDRNMNEKEEEYSIDAYYEQLIGCINMLDSYFDELKKANVYDNSTIVVMADHGNSCSFDEPGVYNWETCKNPIFMVKKKNRSSEHMINNDLPMSYVDIEKIMLNIYAGKSDDIWDERYIDNERKYLIFHYYDKYKSKGAKLVEYKQFNDIKEPLVESNNVYVNKWDW